MSEPHEQATKGGTPADLSPDEQREVVTKIGDATTTTLRHLRIPHVVIAIIDGNECFVSYGGFDGPDHMRNVLGQIAGSSTDRDIQTSTYGEEKEEPSSQ